MFRFIFLISVLCFNSVTALCAAQEWPFLVRIQSEVPIINSTESNLNTALIQGYGVLFKVKNNFFISTSSHLVSGKNLKIFLGDKSLNLSGLVINNATDTALLYLESKDINTPIFWSEHQQKLIWNLSEYSFLQKDIFKIPNINSVFTVLPFKMSAIESSLDLKLHENVGVNFDFKQFLKPPVSFDGVYWVVPIQTQEGQSGSPLFQIHQNQDSKIWIEFLGILNFYNTMSERSFYARIDHLLRHLDRQHLERNPADKKYDLHLWQFDVFKNTSLFKPIEWYFDKGLRRRLFFNLFEKSKNNPSLGNGVNLDRGQNTGSLLNGSILEGLPGFYYHRTRQHWIGLNCPKNQKKYLMDINSFVYCGSSSLPILSTDKISMHLKPTQFRSEKSDFLNTSLKCTIKKNTHQWNILLTLQDMQPIQLSLDVSQPLSVLFNSISIITATGIHLDIYLYGLVFSEISNKLIPIDFLSSVQNNNQDELFVTLKPKSKTAFSLGCDYEQ